MMFRLRSISGGVFMIKKTILILCFVMVIGLLLCACSNKNGTSETIASEIITSQNTNSENSTGQNANGEISTNENAITTDYNITEEDKTIVLKNATLIDGTGAAAKPNMYILIEDGKIKELGTKNEVVIPSEAKVINLNGSTVLPGWINSHVHQGYDEVNLQNWLNAGVTSVRVESPGAVENFLSERERLNSNLHNSFIVSATPILKIKGGYGYGDAILTSPENAQSTVLDYIDKGVDIIKFSLEDSLPPGTYCEVLPAEYVKSIVDAAHSKNIKVSVHISHAKFLSVAINAGVDDIAHMVVDPLDSDTIKAIIAKDIYIVPTLELWKGVGWGYTASSNLSKFYQAGGKIAFGTDFAGYTMTFDKGFPITEVLQMQKAGMSNMDIIVSATKNAAHVCGLDNVIGTIEIGKKADMFIVSGDPLKDINVLAKAKMVIHNGTVISIN